MDRVTIDLGETEFAARMTFVALSRAKRFDGLRVVGFDFNRYKGIQNLCPKWYGCPGEA
jgi:hypothetical protein